MNTTTVSTNTTQEEDLAVTSTQDSTSILMWQVFSPVLIIVGTVGNILSIVVLSRKSIRNSGVSRYLICLAVADLLVLYTGLLRQWILYTFTFDIRDRNAFICKLNVWMTYFSLDLSAWILAFVTVERAISVWKPHKVKLVCNSKVFVVNIAVLVVLLLIINGHFLFGMDIESTESDKYECKSLSADYERFQDGIFPWIDLLFFCIGPFICHLAGNTVLVVGLIRVTRTMAQYSLENADQEENRRQQVSSMTILLLCMNAMYIVCTLPISMYFVQVALYALKDDAKRRLVYACVNLLMYLNNSTNFITYMVSGRRFRAEVYTLFCRKAIRPTPSFIPPVTRSASRILETSYYSTVT